MKRVKSEISKVYLKIIRWFPNKVDWTYICINKKLSEEFIVEFQDKVEWFWISHYQNLSESLIREFKDSVYWGFISEYQKLSEAFLIEFIDEIKVFGLKNNHKIPEEVKERVLAMRELMQA